MFLLENFTNQELLSILRCTKLNSLYDSIDIAKVDAIYATIKKTPALRPIPNKALQASLEPISNSAIYPFLILWSIIGIVASIGTLPATICTVVMLLSSMLVGGFFFYSNYKDLKKRELKHNKTLLLNELKHEAANLLLSKAGFEIQILDKPEYPNKRELALILGSFKVGMVISSSLFGTYFLGLLAVFSSAAIPPIGILIALGAATCIGIYFSYYHYRMIKEDDLAKFNQKCENVIIEKKISLCNKLLGSNPESVIVDEIQKTKPIYATQDSQLVKTFSFKLNRISPAFFQPANNPQLVVADAISAESSAENLPSDQNDEQSFFYTYLNYIM